MSDETTPGRDLREQIAEAFRQHHIDPDRIDRAQEADHCACGPLIADWDEHWADIAKAVVQPELDWRDAEIKRLREAVTETEDLRNKFHAVLKVVNSSGERLDEQLRQAEAAIARVRALHTRTTSAVSLGPVCGSCIDAHSDQPAPWPCPTITALDQPEEGSHV